MTECRNLGRVVARVLAAEAGIVAEDVFVRGMMDSDEYYFVICLWADAWIRFRISGLVFVARDPYDVITERTREELVKYAAQD